MGGDREDTEPPAALGDSAYQRVNLFSWDCRNDCDEGESVMNNTVRDAIIHIEQAMLLLKHDTVYGHATVLMALSDLDAAHQRLSQWLKDHKDDES